MLDKNDFNKKVFEKAAEKEKAKKILRGKIIKTTSLFMVLMLVCSTVFIASLNNNSDVPDNNSIISTESVTSGLTENNSADESKSNHTSNETSETLIPNQIPDWYSPGNLDVYTLTSKENPLGNVSNNFGASPFMFLTAETKSKNTSIDIPTSSIIDILDGDITLLRVQPESAGVEYTKDNFVYYNTETEEYICIDDDIKAAVKNRIPDFDNHLFIMHNYNTLNQQAVFRLIEDSENDTSKFYFYLYDFSDDSLTAFPQIPYTLNLPFCFNRTYTHNIYWTATEENSELSGIFISKLQKGEMTYEKISTDGAWEFWGTSGGFTQEGNVYVYLVLDQEGLAYKENSPKCNWVAYNIEAGFSHHGIGRIIRFFDNDNYVIVETENGVKVYDTRNGEDVTDTLDIPDWAKNELVITNSTITDHRYSKKLTLSPLFSEDEDIVICDNVDVIYKSDEYVYTYSHGDNFVMCYSMIDGSSFAKTIDQSFVDAAQTVNEITDHHVEYRMFVNEEKTKLLLFYYKSNNNG